MKFHVKHFSLASYDVFLIKVIVKFARLVSLNLNF